MAVHNPSKLRITSVNLGLAELVLRNASIGCVIEVYPGDPTWCMLELSPYYLGSCTSREILLRVYDSLMILISFFDDSTLGCLVPDAYGMLVQT